MGRKRKETGWAWQPDSKTTKAIAKGSRKLARHRRKFDPANKEVNTMAQRKTKTTKAKAKTTSKTATNVVSLKELLKSSKMDPKSARRKLRAAGIKGHDEKARWEFTKPQASAAKKALGL